MRKNLNNNEWKMQIYYFKVSTFRRTLELTIWGTKEEFDKYYWGLWYEYDSTTAWLYMFDEKNNCNIIRLRHLDIYTLIHELMHCVIAMCDQCWMPVEWEPPAYIYEELFCKIWCKLWNKFVWDKKTEKYFLKD